MKHNGYTARPWTSSPYRRRRVLWSVVLILLTGAIYDIGLGAFSPDSSRAGRVAQAKPQLAGAGAHADVREIDAFLHLLTELPERKLDEDGGSIRVEGLGSVVVDPAEPVDLRVYAPDGDYRWKEHAKRLHEQYPLVVFSKTYCPYSIRAKALLAAYEIKPPPKIIEVNSRSDGPQIQGILSRLTGRSTVPNILLKGGSIGGSDDVHKLHGERRLKALLEEGGLEVKGNGSAYN
ncbi:thioredoxin-like protein [Trametes elegans]|nr:thioredoxin-like protein [Trametes elegans]